MTDPLAALRQIVDGMTPGEWSHHEAGSRALRLLADEATVVGLAEIDSQEAVVHGADKAASLIIAHLAAQIVKEPTDAD